MAVYNRVYCGQCKKEHNVYSDALKEIICSSCRLPIPIKNQKNYFIEYYANGRRIRE